VYLFLVLVSFGLYVNDNRRSPFCYPFRNPPPTSWARLVFEKTFQLYGIIEHGHKQAPVYIYPEGCYAKDINVVLTGISMHLHQLKLRNTLGKRLYLQLDNTTAENKNHTMLAWASVCVSFGWFESIVISFLPIGHTGEDIDSLWSRLINGIKVTGVTRLSEILSSLIDASGNGDKQVEVAPSFLFGGVVDFREWLSDHIVPVVGITKVS